MAIVGSSIRHPLYANNMLTECFSLITTEPGSYSLPNFY